MDTTSVTFQKGRFGSKNLEHDTSQKTLSQLAEPYHLWVLAFISQCPCTGKILTHSLVFNTLQLPSTLLECLLLFKQISLSTAPVINQTVHYARNYLSSDVPIYSSLSQIINKISWFPFRVDWCRTPQCLPSTDHFLSTSTPYLGSWSRNPSVPRYLQTSVAGSLVFDQGSSSLALGRMILRVFDFNSFYSHSLDCTGHLRDHHHYRWPPSRLLTVFIIDW